MNYKSRPWLGICLTVLVTLGMSACGGGGGSSSAPVAQPAGGGAGGSGGSSGDGTGTDGGTTEDSTNDGGDNASGGESANQPPRVQMPATSEATGGGESTISAQDSYDPDGEIVAISWEQRAREAVELRQADTLTPQFTAPDITETVTLTFVLTITDDQGASASSAIDVVVQPSGPRLAFYFPCDGCRFFDRDLAVQGIAENVTELEVAVGTAAGSLRATIAEDGAWRVEDLSLPDQATPSIIVDAGEQEQIQLERRPTLSSLLVLHDPLDSGSYYFLEDFDSRPRLLRYDGLQDRFSAIAEWSADTFDDLVDVALSPNAARMYALDRATPRLFAIDVNNGELRILSGSGTGAGLAMQAPSAMKVDGAGRIIVWDSAAATLFAIDPVSGARSVLADDTRGVGPALGGQALAVDRSTDRAFLFPGEAVLQVSLESGDRQWLPDGSGRLSNPNSTFYDQRRGLLVTWSDQGPGDLVTINPTDGSTEVLPFARNYFNVQGARQITHYENQYLINDFVKDPSAQDIDTVVIVDPATNVRDPLIEDRLGEGTRLPSEPIIALNAAGSQLFLVDTIPIRLDMGDGQRAYVAGAGGRRVAASSRGLLHSGGWLYVLESDLLWRVSDDGAQEQDVSGNARGSGPLMVDAVGMTLGPNGNLLVADAGRSAILVIDPESGDRALLGDNVYNGPDFRWLTGIAFDPDTQTLLVSDTGAEPGQGRLLLVDPSTGERQAVNTGPLRLAAGVAILEGGEQALVNEGDRILMAHLETGSTEDISSVDVGHGEVFADLRSMTLDRQREVIYAWSPAREAILQIDVGSGDRAVVAK